MFFKGQHFWKEKNTEDECAKHECSYFAMHYITMEEYNHFLFSKKNIHVKAVSLNRFLSGSVFLSQSLCVIAPHIFKGSNDSPFD